MDLERKINNMPVSEQVDEFARNLHNARFHLIACGILWQRLHSIDEFLKPDEVKRLKDCEAIYNDITGLFANPE